MVAAVSISFDGLSLVCGLCPGSYYVICLDELALRSFKFATQVSYTVRVKNSSKFFAQVKDQVGTPGYLITDGRYTLTTRIYKELSSTHYVGLVSLTDKRQNNQRVERLNGTVRDRVKPMRGFQREDTAEIMTAAFRNYYNFIKLHNSNNGLTPAQMAGIGVENGKNKWDELLKRSLDHIPQRT